MSLNSKILIFISSDKVDNFKVACGIATLQLLVSLEPIDQFQWDVLWKVAMQMIYAINEKYYKFYWLQAHFIWSADIY